MGALPRAAATEERCRRDCALPVNATKLEWEVGPNPRYGLTLDFLSIDNYRAIGPTRPPHTRGHPWFPHGHGLTSPSKYAAFCQAGCTFFFAPTEPLHGGDATTADAAAAGPSNVTCKRKCDQTYKYNVDGGYSDLAEVARYECYDGCDLALLRCQPGYACAWPSTTGVAAEANWDKPANMTPCAAGTWRTADYLHVSQCFDCPPGRYRESPKGRSLQACSKCPAARYVNASGATLHTACLRCPAGRFSEEPGAGLCHSITYWSGGSTASGGGAAAYKRNAAFEGCNAASQECGTQANRETYPTLRKPAEYLLCKDKAMFALRANQDLYPAAVDPTALDTNKEVLCDNYLTGDFNYDLEQLVTKVEARSHDGHAFDATPPRGFF